MMRSISLGREPMWMIAAMIGIRRDARPAEKADVSDE